MAKTTPYKPPNVAQGPVPKAATATKDYDKLVCDWFESAIAVAPSLQHRDRTEYLREQLPSLIKALRGSP